MWIVSENLQRSAYVIFDVSLKPNLNSFCCYWDWGMNCVVLFDGNMLQKFVEILIYCIIWSISPMVLYVIMIKAGAWLRYLLLFSLLGNINSPSILLLSSEVFARLYSMLNLAAVKLFMFLFHLGETIFTVLTGTVQVDSSLRICQFF